MNQENTMPSCLAAKPGPVTIVDTVASKLGRIAVISESERIEWIASALEGLAALRKELLRAASAGVTVDSEQVKEWKEATEKLEAINQLWVTGGLSCYGTGLVNFVSVLIELAKKWREIEGVYHGMLGMCQRGGMKKDSDPRYFILNMIDKAAAWDRDQAQKKRPAKSQPKAQSKSKPTSKKKEG
jgi:hypothetical protein